MLAITLQGAMAEWSYIQFPNANDTVSGYNLGATYSLHSNPFNPSYPFSNCIDNNYNTYCSPLIPPSSTHWNVTMTIPNHQFGIGMKVQIKDNKAGTVNYTMLDGKGVKIGYKHSWKYKEKAIRK